MDRKDFNAENLDVRKEKEKGKFALSPFRPFALSCFFVLSCFFAFAQTPAEADRLFLNRQFAEAAEMYEVLVRRNPRNELFNYRLARSMYELGDMALARRHFERSGTRFPLTNFYLGNIYFLDYEFEKSATAYRTFLRTLRAGDERIPAIEQRIRQAEQAARLLSRVQDIAIIDSMVVSKERFLSYYRFSPEIGSLRQERIQIDSIRRKNKITYITQRGDRMFFSDSIEGKMNIFTSQRLLNEWSAPSLLPEIINSPDANENYPFLMLDGVTMYFASDGENSIGGYDIFITRFIPATNTFLTPENIGMPFNSPYNDFMLVIDEINNIGWFASDRYQPEGKVILYFFIPNETVKIFQSDDEAEIRSRARLKTFRQAESPKNIEIAVPKQDTNRPAAQMEFVITGNIVYTHPNQFRSESARKAFFELQEISAQLENMRAQLNTLRQSFATIQTDSERAIATQKILALEAGIREQNQLIQQKTMTVRNEEIKFLRSR